MVDSAKKKNADNFLNHWWNETYWQQLQTIMKNYKLQSSGG